MEEEGRKRIGNCCGLSNHVNTVGREEAFVVEENTPGLIWAKKL